MSVSPFTLLPVLAAALLASCVGPGPSAMPDGGRPRPPVPPPLSKGGDRLGDRSFLGLELAEAEALARRRGIVSRVVSVEGRPRPTTRDYRRDRVNFEIGQGRVARTWRG